jgi:hypothetical protein
VDGQFDSNGHRAFTDDAAPQGKDGEGATTDLLHPFRVLCPHLETDIASLVDGVFGIECNHTGDMGSSTIQEERASGCYIDG